MGRVAGQFGKVRQVAGVRVGHIAASALGVMANHCATISGQTDVEFEAVATVRQGQIKRFQGIFQDGAGRSGTAVTQK
jgi:hypothetical protein